MRLDKEPKDKTKYFMTKTEWMKVRKSVEDLQEKSEKILEIMEGAKTKKEYLEAEGLVLELHFAFNEFDMLYYDIMEKKNAKKKK